MALSLTTDLAVRVTADLVKTADLGGESHDKLDLVKAVRLLTGTTAGKADRLFYDERAVPASSSEDLDLVGSLADQFGTTISLARVKLLLVIAAPKNPAATQNTNNVVVGGAAATQWAALLGTTGTVTLRPGSGLLAFAGEADATAYVCAAGATDLLKIANSGAGTEVVYQIVVVGASA